MPSPCTHRISELCHFRFTWVHACVGRNARTHAVRSRRQPTIVICDHDDSVQCMHTRARENERVRDRDWLYLCAKRTRNFSIVQCSAWNTGDVVFKQLFQHIHHSHCVFTVRWCSSFAKTRFIGIIALLRYMPKLKIINTYLIIISSISTF